MAKKVEYHYQKLGSLLHAKRALKQTYLVDCHYMACEASNRYGSLLLQLVDLNVTVAYFLLAEIFQKPLYIEQCWLTGLDYWVFDGYFQDHNECIVGLFIISNIVI